MNKSPARVSSQTRNSGGKESATLQAMTANPAPSGQSGSRGYSWRCVKWPSQRTNSPPGTKKREPSINSRGSRRWFLRGLSPMIWFQQPYNSSVTYLCLCVVSLPPWIYDINVLHADVHADVPVMPIRQVEYTKGVSNTDKPLRSLGVKWMIRHCHLHKLGQQIRARDITLFPFFLAKILPFGNGNLQASRLWVDLETTIDDLARLWIHFKITTTNHFIRNNRSTVRTFGESLPDQAVQ